MKKIVKINVGVIIIDIIVIIVSKITLVIVLIYLKMLFLFDTMILFRLSSILNYFYFILIINLCLFVFNNLFELI